MDLKKLNKKFKTLFIYIFVILFMFSTNSYADNTEDLNLLSHSAILIESNTGRILYSKDANMKMYPASTTKILTAILTIEKGNLNDITTVSKNAISVIPSGYSIARLVQGEQMTIHNLLEVLLVHSANDAANVLAEYISGSIDEFVILMNQKLKDLGCNNSHFMNTNGIHNENHYTTAHDLAVLARYCMKNETFKNIVSMSKCEIPATNKSDKRTYSSTNDSLLSTSPYYREDCVGIKTGFTSQANYCIVSSFKKDNISLIAVVLSSPNLEARYSDLDTLKSYGYEKYSKILAEEEARLAEEQRKSREKNQNNHWLTGLTDSEAPREISFVESLLENDILIIFLRAILTILIFIFLFLLLFISYRKKNSNIDENELKAIEDSNDSENLEPSNSEEKNDEDIDFDENDNNTEEEKNVEENEDANNDNEETEKENNKNSEKKNEESNE